jgi:hypothetical protein
VSVHAILEAMLYISAGANFSHCIEAVQQKRAGWAVVLLAGGFFSLALGALSHV